MPGPVLRVSKSSHRHHGCREGQRRQIFKASVQSMALQQRMYDADSALGLLQRLVVILVGSSSVASDLVIRRVDDAFKLRILEQMQELDDAVGRGTDEFLHPPGVSVHHHPGHIHIVLIRGLNR